MSSTVLLSTAYFPPVRYFCKIIQYERVYIEKFENYNKQTYRNRCNILSANGSLALTIPILKSGELKTPIQEIVIDQRSRWKAMHWRAIESAYRSSPFYIYYADEIKDCFFIDENNLFQYNDILLKCVLDLLGIDKKILFTEDYKNTEEAFDDFSEFIKPKQQSEDLTFMQTPYYQVFERKFSFVSEMSILDLLFNLGPSAEEYLKKCIVKF